MTTQSKTKKICLGAAMALGSLGIGGTSAALMAGGNASAATSSSSTGTPSAQTTPAQTRRRFLRRHTVDATITVKTKNGYETFNLARGTVASITATSITVNSPDGTSLSATINAQTKFHNTTDSELAPGDKVGVLASQGVAKAITAPKSTSSSNTSGTPTTS